MYHFVRDRNKKNLVINSERYWHGISFIFLESNVIQFYLKNWDLVTFVAREHH